MDPPNYGNKSGIFWLANQERNLHSAPWFEWQGRELSFGDAEILFPPLPVLSVSKNRLQAVTFTWQTFCLLMQIPRALTQGTPQELQFSRNKMESHQLITLRQTFWLCPRRCVCGRVGAANDTRSRIHGKEGHYANKVPFSPSPAAPGATTSTSAAAASAHSSAFVGIIISSTVAASVASAVTCQQERVGQGYTKNKTCCIHFIVAYLSQANTGFLCPRSVSNRWTRLHEPSNDDEFYNLLSAVRLTHAK